MFSTTAHIAYFSTSCILAAILIPQLYLAIKHKKLQTLVTALTLQRLPAIEALSTFEIPENREAKLICQDPWVSISVTIITIIGAAIYIYKSCSKMTFFKGYIYDNVCTIYLFVSHDCYHVPIKLRQLNGSLHAFTWKGQLSKENVQLLKHTLWDTINMKWLDSKLFMNCKRIDLPESVNIPLWDKIRVRSLMSHDNAKYNIMIKQGGTWYAPKTEPKIVRPTPREEV